MVRMKYALIPALLMVISLPALAQPQLPDSMGKAGETTPNPICSKLTNRSTVSIQGTLATMTRTLPNGDLQQFSDNFKLLPNEQRDICAAGPFYEGRRIELTIRTLFPLFSCKTQLGKEIFLDMEEDADGIKHYSATCY